jgi:hypothetical protein
MTTADETELHRLSEMLRLAAAEVGGDSPLIEGLKKAGIALALTFIRGERPQLEASFAQLGQPLGESQLAHLRSLGIDLDSPLPS